jgi:nitrogen regulatory protein PII
MKCITLIIHSSAKTALIDFFHGFSNVERFTIVDCEGYDESDLRDPLLSTADLVIGFVPRVRIELILQDLKVASVLAELRKPGSVLAGLGVYWITTVEEEGTL